ncbi:hypothetical protein H6P81_007079 [Aristolochia fimbriata]|uniref:NB-ARC domain-containing protein n=1 Tax=Aristolochia fimbriata TaxID=158543 RepID=A0AAV7EZ39_ARIFI|nr:hypothetical protein H6P81_007079 [Aristolochia fimbriata]
MDQAAVEHDHCLCGWFPNWKQRYKLSKRAMSYVLVVKDLREKEHRPMNDFEVFASTKLAMSQVFNALDDPNMHIIGVYGMGGVGKTSLIKEVAKWVKTDKSYEEVVMVTVSEKPDLKQIQREIAEKLGLNTSKKLTFGEGFALNPRRMSLIDEGQFRSLANINPRKKDYI